MPAAPNRFLKAAAKFKIIQTTPAKNKAMSALIVENILNAP